MSRVSFIIANAAGRPLLSFESLTAAKEYRAKVQNERVRFQILKETLTREIVA